MKRKLDEPAPMSRCLCPPRPSALVQESNRVRDEVKYASALAKAGSVAVRGIYWDPSMDATSIQTAQGLVFPVRLHNSFLLEDSRILLAGEGLRQHVSIELPALAAGPKNVLTTKEFRLFSLFTILCPLHANR